MVALTLSVSSRVLLGVGVGLSVGVIGAFCVKKALKAKEMKVFQIEMIEELHKPWVHMKDPERVAKIISGIVEGGKDKLQVIADFDRTLTPHSFKGKKIPSCHCILDNSPYLPPGFREKAAKIRDTYYPLEISPDLTIAEKYPLMVEWWTKAHNLLLTCNLTRKTIEETVASSDTMLREGCDWMFQQLSRKDIPLLVFSAGVGDVIEEIIRQKSKLYSNIKIVSNYLDYNSQGHVVGFQGEMIHVFNKNENAIHSSDYFERISHRNNALLLGDSMGDLHMAEGAVKLDNLLKIGFLNDKDEELLPTYKEAWDIVIVQDTSLDVVNALLKPILSL